jgi:tRNA(fMet)-specific endonuclease VapC
MIILDSDYLSLIAWPESPISQEIRTALADDGDDFCTTVVNYEEQTRGWLSHLSQSKDLAEQVARYEKLQRHLAFYVGLRIIEFDETAAAHYQRLKKTRIRIAAMDLKIASIALANDYRLVTRNLSDFASVPGLKLENLLWKR